MIDYDEKDFKKKTDEAKEEKYKLNEEIIRLNSQIEEIFPKKTCKL